MTRRLNKRDLETLEVQIPEALLPVWEAMLDEENFERICIMGGRGGGKSKSICILLLILAINKVIRAVFARESYASLEDSLYQELADIIHEYDLYSYFRLQPGKSRIIGIGPENKGTVFLFKGMQTHRAGAIKGMTNLDILVIDEANQVSAEAMELMRRTLRKGYWRKTPLEILMWNPQSITDYVEEMYCDPNKPQPKTLLVHLNLDANEFAPDKLILDWATTKILNPKNWRHVFKGERKSITDDNVMTNWAERNMDAELKIIRRDNPTVQPLLGLDFGFTDPTTLVECFIWDRILYVTNEAYARNVSPEDIPGLIAGDPLLPHHKWVNPHSGKWRGIKSARLGNLIACDESRPDTIKLLKNKGLNVIKSAKKLKGETNYIKEGLSFLNGYMIFINPKRCPNTIRDFQSYKFKRNPDYLETDPRSVTEDLIDEYNDTVDALRYATDRLRRMLNKRQSGGHFAYTG